MYIVLFIYFDKTFVDACLHPFIIIQAYKESEKKFVRVFLCLKSDLVERDL